MICWRGIFWLREQLMLAQFSPTIARSWSSYRATGLWIAWSLRHRVPGFTALPCPRLTAHSRSCRGPRSFAALGISCSMTIERDLTKSKGGSRKRKAESPCVLVRQSIQAAVKEGSWESAYKSYEEAKAEGIKLQADAYNSLLFLCAHGDAWEDRCGGMSQPGKEELNSERFRIGQQVFSEMQSELGQPSEMCYTALARLAATAGDGDKALALAKDFLATGMTPKLRVFTPALCAFAASHRADSALGLYKELRSLELELTEGEFRLVIAALVGTQKWDDARAIFRTMADELTTLENDTLDVIGQFFRGMSNGQSKWMISEQTVDSQGRCSDQPAIQLKAIALSPAESQEFREGVVKLANKFEKGKNAFSEFVCWLDKAKQRPTIIIDGANIAFYGQNTAEGGFKFRQIMQMVKQLQGSYPESKVLVVLHVGRVRMLSAQPQEVQDFFKGLNEAGSFGVAPLGSNDDWYWLYAAIAGGEESILVSNDEMRDHTFQLVAPRYFNKWKQKHQLRYKFTPEGIEFLRPAPFTTCIQELEGGIWMFPRSTHEWLRATPS